MQAARNPPEKVTATPTAKAEAAGGLWPLVGYFLKLGTVGFGGPVALVGFMHRDLVERRGWITEDRTYVRSTALRSNWSSGHGVARGQPSFYAIPIAIWDITLAISAGHTTAHPMKRPTGKPIAIR